MWGGLTKTIPPQCVLPLRLESPLSLHCSVNIFCPSMWCLWNTRAVNTCFWGEESISELFQTNPWFTPHHLLVCRQQLCDCWRHFLQEFRASPGHIRQQHDKLVPWSGTSTYDTPSVAFMKPWVRTQPCWQEGLRTVHKRNQTESKAHCQCWCNYHQSQKGETGVLSCNFKDDLRALTIKMCWERAANEMVQHNSVGAKVDTLWKLNKITELFCFSLKP